MKNIIDVPDMLPSVDVYIVKNTGTNMKVLTTDNIKEAKDVCEKTYGTAVYNSRGEKIYGKLERKVRKTSKYIGRIDTESSKYVYLNNTNLYKDNNSKIPSRSISGTYKISKTYEGYSNRIPITTLEDEDFIIGYINK